MSGLIINSSGWVDGDGFQSLLRIASAFSVDCVLVLAHDRLVADLRAAFAGAQRALRDTVADAHEYELAAEEASRHAARRARARALELEDLCVLRVRCVLCLLDGVWPPLAAITTPSTQYCP